AVHVRLCATFTWPCCTPINCPTRRSPHLPYTTLFRSVLRQDGALHFRHARARRRSAFQQGFKPVQRPVRIGIADRPGRFGLQAQDRKSTRLNSSHVKTSYSVFCFKQKKHKITRIESEE